MIKYCCFLTGDDGTGDGSAGNPYKTITQASTGLTGGDEVRVAKSAAASNLTGTLGFTAGSTAVTGSGTAFTTELAIGDFIKGGDGQWYEVVTITDNTNAVLYKVYPSSTQSGVSSQKLGVTSTGEAAATSTAIQTVSVPGSSTASRLKISGGWDLGTTTQDGQTYFRQMHSTFANRYGRGLYASNKHYIEIERLHFLRYDNCIYVTGCDYWKITSPNLLSAGNEALYLLSAENNEIITPVVNSSNDRGIYISSGHNNIITSPICNSNNYGISLLSPNNTITDPICNSNTNGIYFQNTGHNNTIISPTCNKNTRGIYFGSITANNVIISPICNDNSYGIYVADTSSTIVNNYSGTGNSSTDIYISAKQRGEYPVLKCQHFKTTGDNRCYYEHGITYRDTANARSTQCLKYDPTSATYYILQSFFFKADSGVAQTLSAYIKDDASFNGDIQAAIYFMGEKITGWTAWTPTTSYVQKSIIAAAGDITEDGVLELRIKVRGTAGNVFVDDLATA